jgi:hypothetical protein
MWSEVELQLGTMMVAFLGESATPTVAIYLDLLAFRTRIAALEAAAKNTLIYEHHEIFKALVTITRSAAKQRDKLAHWIWTCSSQLPDALLLIDPRILLPAHNAAIAKALSGTALKGHILSEEDINVDKSEQPAE